MNLQMRFEIPVSAVCGDGDQIVITLTESDLVESLHDTCEMVHGGCDNGCPVYQANGSKIPRSKKKNENCKCFRDGRKMLAFLRKQYDEGII